LAGGNPHGNRKHNRELCQSFIGHKANKIHLIRPNLCIHGHLPSSSRICHSGISRQNLDYEHIPFLAIYDLLNLVFPSNKVILEEMTGPDKPWDDLHHKSYSLPELRRIEAREFITTMNGDALCPVNPLATHGIYVERNMESIAETIPIDNSITLGIVENIFVDADCSPEEIQIYTELFGEFRDVFS
jgi:hypothetical protein